MKTASRLERVFDEGHFAVTTECGPPRGSDPEVIRKKGELLRGSVDAINVTDNQTSVVRMASIRSRSPSPPPAKTRVPLPSRT